MMTAGLSRYFEPLAAKFVALPDEAEIEQNLGIIANLRHELGDRLPAAARLSERERAELGTAAHEAAHAAVAIACGDEVVTVAISSSGTSGFVWQYVCFEQEAGPLIARAAVLLAGEQGYLRATGDLVGALAGGRFDVEDLDQAFEGLPDSIKESATEIGRNIVDMVLDACWPSVVDLAMRLVVERRVEAYGHELVAVPAEVRRRVKLLVR